MVFILVFGACLANPCNVFAAENGVGHYSPGAMASFIDAAPPGFATLNSFNFYDGSAGANRLLPLDGFAAANLQVTSYADLFALAYKTPYGILDGKLAGAILVPYVWVDVRGQIELNGGGSGRLDRGVTRSDSANGIGDTILIPFWLAWNRGDFKWDVRFDVYAPTGEYNKSALANVGMNYWTFEPVASFSWISSKIGLEVSAYAGLDFNTTNDATDYLSGNVFHLDVTVAEHLPLFNKQYGFMGVGFNAFYWDQISGDSGSGAVLGSFEGSTLGIGPVVSYISPPICGHMLSAEVKWLPEIEVKNRLKGDYVWFKLALAF